MGLAVVAGYHHAADERPDAVGGEVFADEHGHHAGRGGGGPGVNAFDHGVGMGRPHENGVGLARDIDVVGIASLAQQKALVFLAAHAGADAILLHD